MKFSKLALIIAAATVVCSAFAQGGGGGQRGQRGFGGGQQYSPMNLLRNEDVQKELNITDDQKTKITDLQSSTRQKMQDAAQNAGDDRAAQAEARAKISEEAAKELSAILTPDQTKRLRELQIQWTGVAIVVNDKQIQSDLGITDDQKAKFKDLQEKQQQANTEARQNANGDRAAMREAMQKNQKIMEEEIGKVLTEDQKKKLADMGGKPMAKPASLSAGGRRGGGGGGF